MLQTKNIDFETAFSQAKRSWRQEFKMVPDAKHYQEIPKFYKQRILKNKIDTLISTLKYAVPLLLFLIVSAYFLKPILFKYFTVSTIVVLALMPFVNYIFNVKEFGVIEKYRKINLTLDQNSSAKFCVSIIFSLLFIKYFNQDFEKVWHLVHLQFSNMEFSEMSMFIFVLLTIFFIDIFILISQNKCLRQINAIKPFLNNFETAE